MDKRNVLYAYSRTLFCNKRSKLLTHNNMDVPQKNMLSKKPAIRNHKSFDSIDLNSGKGKSIETERK